MLFEHKKGLRFGYNNKLFINDKGYISISRIGPLIDEKGYLSPVDCGGAALKKNLSLRKGFAESIERRALSLGSNAYKHTNYCYAYNLISNCTEKIPVNYTKYSKKEPVVDTTGTAAHTNPKIAVKNAVTELLEKNAIFLFWYGQFGKKINFETNSFFYKYLKKQGYNTYLYLISEFSPLKIVILIAMSDKNVLKFKFGIGSSLNINKAIEKAFSEAYLLGSYYESVLLNMRNGSANVEEEKGFCNKFFDQNIISYLNYLIELPRRVGQVKEESEIDFTDIYGSLPKWIKELYITILPQSINEQIIVTKAYSPQLLNHIPMKESIDINSLINNQLTKLSQKEIDKIPDCPIV